MRRYRANSTLHFSQAMTVVIMLVTLDIIALRGLYPEATWFLFYDSLDPQIRWLWMLGALVAGYCLWVALLTRQWISDAGAPGFLIAILGLDLRRLGDLLWTLTDPREGFLLTVEQAYDPAHFPYITATARFGGLAAFIVGVLLVVVVGVVDFRARCRQLVRRGYARRVPSWF